MTTINPDILAQLESATIASGAHGQTFTGTACSMEWVSLLADEGFTDAPDCASPIIRRYVITLNDRWDDERRQTLKPYLVRMIGTGTDGKDPIRERITTRYAADLVGDWLRLAGLNTEADALVGVTDPAEIRRLIRTARDAAWSLRAQRRDLCAQKVREHLANKPVAVADAVAVADTDAVADAAAVAVAAAGESTWSAAYKAARAYYDAHSLPISQEVGDLAEAQQDAALDLLDRLIEAEESA